MMKIKLFNKNNKRQMNLHNSSTGEIKQSPEQVNHPAHYNQYPMEVIDMMIKMFGLQHTYSFCLLNAFKYRMRAGHKDNVEQDLAKEQWYLNKAKELQEKIYDSQKI